MRPHAFDANAINQFQSERIQNSPGVAHQAIESIFRDDCIALDEGGHCLQEWVECAGGKFPFALTDWVADQAVAGKIKLFPLCPNTVRDTLNGLGIPKKDQKWVRLAVGSDGRIIITNDIDFFDPAKKSASAKEKEKIKNSGKGPCSKALFKQFGVEIRTL